MDIEVCCQCGGPAGLIALSRGHATVRCRNCGWVEVVALTADHYASGHMWVGGNCADPIEITLAGDVRAELGAIAAEVGELGDDWQWASCAGDYLISGEVN